MGMAFLPPEKYDHEPEKKYQIKYGWWPRPYAPIGGDTIYLPRPSIKWMLYPNQSYAALIRHEIGHLNGWPQDHPGMRRVDNYD